METKSLVVAGGLIAAGLVAWYLFSNAGKSKQNEFKTTDRVTYS